MFVLNTVVQKIRSKKTKIYACFVDVKKAFDYVNRSLLWFKLTKYGISTESLNILRSILFRVALS